MSTKSSTHLGMKAASRLSDVIQFLILLVSASIVLIPILMMLLGSFKTQGEALQFTLSLPTTWHPENYTYVIETGNIFRGYYNSTLITVAAVAITLITGALAGIVTGRNRDRWAKGLYYYFIFGLTATMQTVTTFVLFKQIGIYGSYFSVIMLFAAVNLPFTVMTMSSFVKGVPREIDEAAFSDGCGPVRMVFQIHMPIMRPIMVTNLIITAISVWNNFMIPLYFFNTSSRSTISMMVYNFYGLYSRNWHYVFAALTLTVLPVMILYLFLQKYIVAGMTSGAVKG